MAKKAFLLIVLIAFTGGLFAETNNHLDSNVERAKNSFALSFGLFSAELSYERMINRHFSLGLNTSYSAILFMEAFTASLQARVYPFGKSFFLGLGLGYTYGYGAPDFMRDMLLDFLTSGWWHSQDGFNQRTHGFLIQPVVGWKIDIGKPDRFIIPINAGLGFKVGSELPDIIPHLRIGLGYSF